MRPLFFFISLFAAFSCSQSGKKQGDYSQMAFSLDTVMVDPGEEILFLKGELRQSILFKDKKYLFNFNQDDHSVERINLDDLILSEKIPFEAEGPNGTGNYFHTFLAIGEDSILFSGYQGSGIFDTEGKKIKDLDFKKVGSGEHRLNDDEFFVPQAVFPGNPELFLGFIRNWEDKSLKLVLVNFAEDWVDKMELPEFDKLKGLYAEFSDGNFLTMTGPDIYLISVGDKILIGNNAYNELFWLPPGETELTHYSYQSHITEDSKKGKYPSQVDRPEEVQQISRKIREEISFGRPVWDEENRIYYRFSYKEAFTEEVPSNTFSSSSKADVYLTIFDENLQMIGEAPVPMLEKTPARHFAKNGKIWIFENIEDELGFVRLSIEGI
ncbi:DUF4221 family protein [Negadavirga shengliensis]|uniref:DUF4221 family protein n=1 Tax=Negadavirga shengliensis TaxID=1389218 RepID=A0ABV9T1D1_9BACT